MSENSEKTYTAKEMGEAVLKKCEELYKNSNLAKSNSAHELETGGEPSSDESEAPEQLQVGDVTRPGQSEKKSKKKGDGESEDGDTSEDSADGGEDTPEHEEGMDTETKETKEAHDATESESDKEEVDADKDVAAQESDEADADKIEDKEESSTDKKEDKKDKKEDKKPFEKSEKIEKSLFSSDKMCSPKENKQDKSDVFWDIQRCTEKIKDMKELSYTIETEAPEAKNVFEKEFTKEKAKLTSLVKKYNGLKKSEDMDETDIYLLKKAERVIADKPTSLKSFIRRKDLKKKV